MTWPAHRRGTVARGYGKEHRAARAAALAAYRPGDPCARCGLPLGTDATRLHLDHTDDRRGYSGLAHSVCNVRAGARKGQRLSRPRPVTRLEW